MVCDDEPQWILGGGEWERYRAERGQGGKKGGKGDLVGVGTEGRDEKRQSKSRHGKGKAVGEQEEEGVAAEAKGRKDGN